MNSYPQKPVVDRPKNVSHGGCRSNRLLGLLLLLFCAVGFSMKAAAADWTRQNDGNATITAESCLPANGFIDPGETNTLSFVIKNTSGGDRTEVKVNILEQGGVTFRSGEVNVGTVAKDATFTVSFTFRADGSCGGALTPTLRVAAKDRTTEDVAFNAFQLGATVKTQYGGSNTSAITINDYLTASDKLGRATPYPSTINVSGVPKADTGETVDKVTVTLNNISHGYSQDIQALLVAPNGKRIALMGRAGGSQSGTTAPVNDVTLTFDESASGPIPQNAGQITSGTYRTSDYNTTAYTFPDIGAKTDSSLSALNNIADPNGSWRLFVVDASMGDQGVVAGGWNLSLRTTKIVCCGAGQTWPFVSRIGEKTVTEDLGGAENVEIAAFTVKDLDDGDANKLTVSATSSDQSKVTNDNLVVEGSGNNRVLKVKKLVANANGNATITVVVTDPQGHTSTSSFLLKITPVNDQPTITDILGQKVTQGTATGPLAFTVGDIETLAENLLVLVGTSDPAIVPVQNIVISGTGANKTVNVFPATSTTAGSATITLTVRDLGDGTNPAQERSTQFVVDFGATSGSPTITPYTGITKTVNEDGSITVPFTVRSGTTSVSPDALIVTATAANGTLLPQSGITLSGSGTDRFVTLRPAANQNGQTSVTLRVARADNSNLFDQTSFTLVVNPINDRPTITSVGPQITNEDTTSGDIVFTVGDVETAVANLAVTLTTDNPTLVPNIPNPADLATAGGYSIAVNGATRTLRIRPAPNQFGKATVTVTVQDGGDGTHMENRTASTTFVLTVNAVNDAPNITSVGNTTESLVTWTDTDPTISFAEDSGSTADATKGQRTILLRGITPGPANEANQTVTLSASSSNSDIISIVKIDPASVSGESANTTLTVRLGENRYTPADNLVEITLTLTDNGGTELGGVNTRVRKFKINVTPVNDVPTLSFPNLPAPLPEQTLSELNAPKNRSFTMTMSVNDVETPRTLIEMLAIVADDPETVFPAGSILFDPARTLVTFLPVKTPAVLPYTVTVTIRATDNGATNSGGDRASVERTFKVTIRDIEPPTITVTPSTDLQIDEDGVATLQLTLTDNKPLSELTFSVRSDNEVLVPRDNILLGPLNGNTKTVAIVPAADQNGIANVTITALDLEGLEAQAVIRLTVRAVSDPPTLTLHGIIAPTLDSNGVSHDASITILEDGVTKDDSRGSKLLEFTVSDAANETPVDQLVITRASSNTDLVPVSNIVISGSGNLRTMTITPVANRNGATTITLTVTDESGLNATGKFTLNVTAVNDAPTINQVNNISLQQGAGEQTVNLSGITVGPDSGQTITSVVVSATDKGSSPAVNNLVDITQQPALPDSNGATSFRFTPRPFTSGTSTLTVTVTDSGGTANGGVNTKTMSFDVAIARVNQNPTITFQEGQTVTSVDRTVQPGGNTGVITFYVGDAPNETAVERLVVTAVSSNPTLIPNSSANLQLGGSGSTRGILIQPAVGQAGTAVVAITVADLDGGTRTATVNVTVVPGQHPTISLTPTSQTIGINEFSTLIQINIADAQTAADSLKVGYQDAGLVSSDNPTLVPATPSNIQFGGTGSSRAMIILPTRDQTGTANITVRVKDADGNLGSAVFTLRVLGSAPTISAATPSSVTVNVGTTSTPAVNVTVDDKETFPGFLTVTGKSSDTSVIPDSNIFVLGNNSTRSVTVLAGTKGGSAVITLTVTDGEGQTATTSFAVTVVDNDTPPTITPISAQVTTRNTATGPITFVVGDAETPAANLVVTTSSANTTLVPDASIQRVQSTTNPASWSLIITPANGQVGTALITVTVQDGVGKTSSRSFALTVSDSIVPNDFNGDGSQDIIFRDNAGFLAAWFMQGDDRFGGSFLAPNHIGDNGWTVVGTGDFDGDGKTDLLFNHADGSLAVWKMNGVTMTSAVFLSPGNTGSTSWKAVATGDFNKDGKVDILFQNTDMSLAIWYMNGTTLDRVAMVNPARTATGWTVVGTGDIDGDSNTDIVFQHTDGTLAVWYLFLGEQQLKTGYLQHPGDANWRAVGTIDLNSDGNVDLLFQNSADGNLAVWYMNKDKLVLGKLLSPANPGGTWKAVAP